MVKVFVCPVAGAAGLDVETQTQTAAMQEGAGS